VLGNDVNDLVSELEGLRLAIDDTQRAERGDVSALGSALPPTTQPEPAPPEQRPQTRPQQ
jgi:hypothetical protein